MLTDFGRAVDVLDVEESSQTIEKDFGQGGD